MPSTTSCGTPVAAEHDTVDELAGIGPGTRLDALRAQRAEVVRYAQGSYRALLEPDDPGGVSRVERELIALRVAVLTAHEPLATHHRARLRQLEVPAARIADAESFPPGAALSPREIAILRHIDRLTDEPRAAGPADIRDLEAVGLSARDIVTIAQLIAFLSFQIRVLAGLRALGEE